MFYCSDCSSYFEEPEVSQETHGLDTMPYEPIDACPNCHSTNLEEASYCKVCNDWFTYEEMSDEDDTVCKDCAIEISDRWERVKNRIKQFYFNEAEREFLEILEEYQ